MTNKNWKGTNTPTNVYPPVAKNMQLDSKQRAQYKYMRVRRTCLGAILLVLAMRPNSKLCLICSQKNFILVSGYRGSYSYVLINDLAALSHMLPTLPNTFFLAFFLYFLFYSSVNSSQIIGPFYSCFSPGSFKFLMQLRAFSLSRISLMTASTHYSSLSFTSAKSSLISSLIIVALQILSLPEQ